MTAVPLSPADGVELDTAANLDNPALDVTGVLEALMRRPNLIVTRSNLIEAVYTIDDEI